MCRPSVCVARVARDSFSRPGIDELVKAFFAALPRSSAASHSDDSVAMTTVESLVRVVVRNRVVVFFNRLFSAAQCRHFELLEHLRVALRCGENMQRANSFDVAKVSGAAAAGPR